MNTSSNTEKQVAFRNFLKAAFGARISVTEEGLVISRVKGRKARAEITNAPTVLRKLNAQATLINETPTRRLFKFGKGKQQATISLAHVGGADVLTMRSL